MLNSLFRKGTLRQEVDQRIQEGQTTLTAVRKMTVMKTAMKTAMTMKKMKMKLKGGTMKNL